MFNLCVFLGKFILRRFYLWYLFILTKWCGTRKFLLGWIAHSSWKLLFEICDLSHRYWLLFPNYKLNLDFINRTFGKFHCFTQDLSYCGKNSILSMRLGRDVTNRVRTITSWTQIWGEVRNVPADRCTYSKRRLVLDNEGRSLKWCNYYCSTKGLSWGGVFMFILITGRQSRTSYCCPDRPSR